ncbi:MAG TPA: Clp protease N-terminal domain-containing protein, partial [Gemmatales bacterium]|nr:Clp protease N-terminal domain-containing protein [Gemmatales bacterium]
MECRLNMLLPEMTSGTRQALLASLAWQEALGSPEISALHVLLGLLHEEEGIAATILRGKGVTLAGILQQQEIATSVPVPWLELPNVLPALLLKLLYDARLLALESTGDPQVQSNHFLQVLLDASPELHPALEKFGFSYQQYQTENTQPSLAITLDEPLQLAEPPEQHSLYRILDANFNRSREALRVLEELARFHWNDSYLTKLAKGLRHQLTACLLQHLPPGVTLGSRDTQADVGTHLSTEPERHRHSLQAVMIANAQRLQESLRT